jgi:hypothetical protein
MFGDMFHSLIPGCEDVMTESTIPWPIGDPILELTSSGSWGWGWVCADGSFEYGLAVYPSS